MTVGYIPYNLDSERPPAEDVRLVLDEYDDLLARCMRGRLDADEHRLMNELYECLSYLEDDYWVGVSDRTIFMITDGLNIDFVMIRYELGLLPIKPKHFRSI